MAQIFVTLYGRGVSMAYIRIPQFWVETNRKRGEHGNLGPGLRAHWYAHATYAHVNCHKGVCQGGAI